MHFLDNTGVGDSCIKHKLLTLQNLFTSEEKIVRYVCLNCINRDYAVNIKIVSAFNIVQNVKMSAHTLLITSINLEVQ